MEQKNETPTLGSLRREAFSRIGKGTSHTTVINSLKKEYPNHHELIASVFTEAYHPDNFKALKPDERRAFFRRMGLTHPNDTHALFQAVSKQLWRSGTPGLAQVVAQSVKLLESKIPLPQIRKNLIEKFRGIRPEFIDVAIKASQESTGTDKYTKYDGPTDLKPIDLDKPTKFDLGFYRDFHSNGPAWNDRRIPRRKK